MNELEPGVFDAKVVAEDVCAANAVARDRLVDIPYWTPDMAAGLRSARSAGGGRFPAVLRSPRALQREIPGPAGPIGLRIVAPANPRGIHLHMHGGGWFMGGADLQDSRLEAIADGAGLVCISVDYRLSPEHPYPAASDDCEEVARWALDAGVREFGVNGVSVGGESSGAQLAAVTLLRLRDKHRLTLRAAVLLSGFFDLALTPSARRYGDIRYSPRTHDLREYVAAFIGHHNNVANPDISPIQADLSSLCPALFLVGTQDPLLDDTMFMHARWIAAGNAAELRLYPGGIHGFEVGRTAIAAQAERDSIEFLKREMAS